VSPALRFWTGLGLVGLLAVQLLPGLGATPIMRAEIYFMDGARAMLERSDFLVPHFQGEPFFDKPPLTYWLIAAAFGGLGETALAARLVSVLAAAATVLVTVALGRRLLGPKPALAGGLILSTTFAFTSFGRLAMSDMLLAFLSTASVVLALAAFEHPRGGPALAALGMTLGLGFLTKGPVALLLPGLGILTLAWQRRGEWPRPGAWLAASAGLFAVSGLGWYVLAWLRLGEGPLAYFFLSENLERFAGSRYDAGQPVWFYLPTYLAEGAPWALFLPLACWRLVGRDGSRWLLSWSGAMLLLLTASRGKLDYYLLPLYPALSLVLGEFFTTHPWGRLERAWARVVLAGAAVGLALGTTIPRRVPEEWLPAAPVGAVVTGVALVGAALLVLAARRASPTTTLLPLAASSAGLFALVCGLFVPAFRQSQPNASVVADVTREITFRRDARMAMCDDPLLVARDVLFRTRLAVEERCDLWAPASSEEPYLVLLPEERRDDLMTIPAVRFVGRYRYLPATALTLRGLLAGPEPAELALIANYPTRDPISLRRNRRDRRRAVQERQAAREEEDPFP
jgi:4-amino-4-deoxy-L-arabinose transferase-like glycosyltransferase